MRTSTCTTRDLMERVAECGDEYREVLMQALVSRQGDSYTFNMDHPGWAEAGRVRREKIAARQTTKPKRAGGCSACGGGKSIVKPAKADGAWHNAVNQTEEQQ